MKYKLISLLLLSLMFNNSYAEDMYTNQYDAIQNTSVGIISGVVGVFTETGSDATKSLAVNPDALETTVGEGIGTIIVGSTAMEFAVAKSAIAANVEIAKAAKTIKETVRLAPYIPKSN